jgi:hypothetical protein
MWNLIKTSWPMPTGNRHRLTIVPMWAAAWKIGAVIASRPMER